MVTLRHDGNDAVVTPVESGWRVEYQGRVVGNTYLEYAIAEAVAVDAKQAVSFVTRLLDQYLVRFGAGVNDVGGPSSRPARRRPLSQPSGRNGNSRFDVPSRSSINDGGESRMYYGVGGIRVLVLIILLLLYLL